MPATILENTTMEVFDTMSKKITRKWHGILNELLSPFQFTIQKDNTRPRKGRPI